MNVRPLIGLATESRPVQTASPVTARRINNHADRMLDSKLPVVVESWADKLRDLL